MWFIIFATLIAAFVYKFIYKHWSFFSDRGLHFRRGVPLLGTHYRMLLGKEPLAYSYQALYNAYPMEPIIGMYDVGGTPTFLPRTPAVIKQIGIKDFGSFMNHRGDFGGDDPMMSNNLFFIKNDEWKEMRSTLSPVFTGSKMRLMHSLITKTCAQFVKFLKDNSGGESKVYDLKDIFTRFTNDSIATCAFGLEVNSMKDRDNEFYRTGKLSTKNDWKFLLKFIGITAFPLVMKWFGIRFVSVENEQYFRGIIRETIRHREENNIVRPDVVSLLMACRAGEGGGGVVEGEVGDEQKKDKIDKPVKGNFCL